MELENTINFYWECANALQSNTGTDQLLKSFYRTNCRKLARGSLQLPEQHFGLAKMCPRCSNLWLELYSSLRLRPAVVASTAKARRLIAKLDESQRTNQRNLLTKTQRKRAKWLKKRTQAQIEICCEFCKNRVHIPLEKPQQKSVEEPQREEPSPEDHSTSKKKKNKRKDKNAGLKLDRIKSLREIKKEGAITSSSSSSVPTGPSTSTSGSSLNKTPSTSKVMGKPMKKKKKKAVKPPAGTVGQSKTQHQNLLTKLAFILNESNKKVERNTTKSRLESMLE